MRTSRWLLGPVLALALTGLPSVSAHADQPVVVGHPGSSGSSLRVTHRGGDADLLTSAHRSRSALTALGAKLSTAADRSGLTTAHLRTILRTDPTAWIAASGRLFYADRGESAHPAVAQDIPPASQPLANTFLLHSKFGSKHTIYLDFDGIGLGGSGNSGSEWLSNGFHTGTFKGFSIDSNYSAFSDTEKAYIQHVWQMTSEKYATFDVDVTTQDPGTSAYNRTSSGDDTYGDHVVFTDDSGAKPSVQCPAGCTGIAFVGGFNDVTDSNGDLEPAWVYTGTMKNEPGDAANTAAHEVGHTLGLSHDGLGDGSDDSAANAAYYEGQGNWFPIMGSSENAVGQWSKGEYANADNSEDDLAVIAAHGIPVIADAEGSVASPFDLGTAPTYAQNGLIQDDADVDVFTVTTSCISDLDVAVAGVGEGQMVDLKLSILNQVGNSVLASDDPPSDQTTSTFPFLPTGLDAATSLANAPIGTYRIQIEGVGSGNPVTTGYSGYSSIGTYHLTASGCATPGGVVPSAPQSPLVNAPDRSTSATISWSAPASAGTPGTITGYRISGIPAGTVPIAASPRSYTVTGLIPGQEYDVKVAALNATGAGPAVTIPITVKTWVPTTAPTITLKVVKNEADISYFVPVNPGHAVFTTWRITISGQNFDDPYGAYSGDNIGGFGNGTYTAKVTLFADADLGSVTPGVTKSFTIGATAPRIGTAISGAKHKPITAGIRWALPTSLGGYPITGWKAIAYRLTKSGGIGKGYVTGMLRPSARSFVGVLPAGRYKFRIVAYNAIGASPPSAYSKAATAR